MDQRTAVYIDYNFPGSRYPNKPGDGNSFYTHGFGGLYSRQFKKYNPGWNVECWKADANIRQVMTTQNGGVTFRMFPSLAIHGLGQYSASMIRYLKLNSSRMGPVVYNISGFDHILFYTMAACMRDQPLVVQHHGESTIRYKLNTRNSPGNLLRRFMRTMEKNAFGNIDKLYVLDEAVKYWLPKGLDNLKIEQRTTGVDETLFSPVDKKTAREITGLQANKEHLLYVGRLNNTKRPDILIDVYNSLKQERKNLQLILLGHENKDQFYQKALDSGAIMHGVVNQLELVNWLSATDIYILPLLDEAHAFGGLGMLPVQAMLCNTPVIGSTLKCFPAQHLHQVGICADNFDTIRQGIVDILDRKKIFDQTRKIAADHFSWRMISEKTAADYTDLIQAKWKV
jgi:glycosyltransferase involved in cell wall biosynthesis